MATKDTTKRTAEQVDVVAFMNDVRDTASANYQALVPTATGENAREIGSVLTSTPAVANEWIHAMLNRIALVIVRSESYQNPWGFMHRGDLEYGEIVEDIFIDLINGYAYDAEVGAEFVHKLRDPDVKSVFHIQNFASYYPVTIRDNELEKAFLSWQGVSDFISRIVERLYTSYQYDEFNLMKYVIAKAIVNGQMRVEYGVNIDALTADDAVMSIKGVSNAMTFMSSDYTEAGVKQFTKKNDQFLIVSSKADAVLDVGVLALAFNMDKAEFMGHKVMVDSFSNIDDARLTKLMSNEKTGVSTYKPLTAAEKQILDKVQAVLIDREWPQIYTILRKFAENYNGNNLSWNYFYHVRGIFSHSPFANAAVFTSETDGEITGVSAGVTSKTVTDSFTQLQLTPDITSTGTVTKAFKFVQTSELTDAGITITDNGLLTLPANSAGEIVTIVVDGTVYASNAKVTPAAAVGTTEVAFTAQ